MSGIRHHFSHYAKILPLQTLHVFLLTPTNFLLCRIVSNARITSSDLIPNSTATRHLSAMTVAVDHDGILFFVEQTRLVNSQILTDVLGKHQSLVGTREFSPPPVAA